jgi:hypothetical protein
MTSAFTPAAGGANGMASAIPKVATDPAKSAAAKNALIDCPLILAATVRRFSAIARQDSAITLSKIWRRPDVPKVNQKGVLSAPQTSG